MNSLVQKALEYIKNMRGTFAGYAALLTQCCCAHLQNFLRKSKQNATSLQIGIAFLINAIILS